MKILSREKYAPAHTGETEKIDDELMELLDILDPSDIPSVEKPALIPKWKYVSYTPRARRLSEPAIEEIKASRKRFVKILKKRKKAKNGYNKSRR